MSGTEKSSTTRRNLLQAAAAAGASTALLGGLGINPALAAAARSEKPLKAAVSQAGLQAPPGAPGKQGAGWGGELFQREGTLVRRQPDPGQPPAASGHHAA